MKKANPRASEVGHARLVREEHEVQILSDEGSGGRQGASCGSPPNISGQRAANESSYPWAGAEFSGRV